MTHAAWRDSARPRRLSVPERMARERDGRLAEIVTREQARLKQFIRRRVADPRDAEDIL